MPAKTPFHVYGPDGFDSAHASLEGARRAAKREARRRELDFQVIECSPAGFPGGRLGQVVCQISGRYEPTQRAGVTERQWACVRAVAELERELGRPPSAHEVGVYMGITRLGARRQLLACAGKGLAYDVPKVVSSGCWKLTEAGRQAPP